MASPQLADPNFARTLVLLIEHSQEGALGVVVNRPLTKTIQELSREVGSAPCHSRQPVYVGGPVPGPLLSLHTKPTLAEMEPLPGVFFAAKKQHLDELVLSEEPAYKCSSVTPAGARPTGERATPGRLAIPAGDGRARLLHRRDALGDHFPPDSARRVLKSMLHVKDLPPDPTVN